MERRLHAIAPPAPAIAGRPRSSLAFKIGFIALMLSFGLSANLLLAIGYAYGSLGGNPLTKIHPATYVAVLAAMLALLEQWRYRTRLPDGGSILAFLALVIGCTAYSMVSVGSAASSVYFDTFIAAGCMAFALETGSERARRVLGYTILVIMIVNIAVAIGENLTHTHLVPLHFGGIDPKKIEGGDLREFRPSAFYEHPLSAGLTTALGVVLLSAMRFRPLSEMMLLLVLLVGLLTFGGRVALVVALALVAVFVVWLVFRDLLTRRVQGRTIGAFLLAGVIAPAVLLTLINTTDIGSRIMEHAYFDGSAEVRNEQWGVLRYLDTRDVLFGTTRANVDLATAQIGLGQDEGSGIENPWLLTFLNLGLFAFVPFMIGLAIFLVHLARVARCRAGWVMLVEFLLIASTSNSLGVKTTSLNFFVAFMIALSGFRRMPERQGKPATKPTATRFRNGPLLPAPEVKGLIAAPPRPTRGLVADVDY